MQYELRSRMPARRLPGSGRRNQGARGRAAMPALARWCIAHRRRVAVAWVAVAVAVLASIVAGAVGSKYATNFTLPGTESQRASDLLNREFKTQSGDVDTIVFHVSRGTVDSPAARAAITPLLERVTRFPHVDEVISPYSPRGAVQISSDRRTAFATINYDKTANLLPGSTGKPLLTLGARCTIPVCRSP